MDKTWYIDECNRQLTDTKFYQRLDEDITAEIQKRVTFYVNRMHKDKFINDKTKQYLIQSDVKPGRFYILPKIHKPGNPGRPIVSSNSHPTERLSHFVDYYLQPLVHKLPSFVKDTNDFLNKLLTIGNLPANSLLVTLDVSSLYTNIPHNIPFLDVSVSLTNDGSISTDLYTKPTDKHQHLLYSSCHPLHTKKAIPFSLALRLRRICSTDATFHTQAHCPTYHLPP